MRLAVLILSLSFCVFTGLYAQQFQDSTVIIPCVETIDNMRKGCDVLTREEAVVDYRLLASSVREIYPSLDDLMTEEEYDRFVEGEITKIPSSISLEDFARLLMTFNHKVHDSHLWFSYGVNTDRNKEMRFPSLLFGKVDGVVKVIAATEEYKKYMGRTIGRINSKRTDALCEELEKYTNLMFDANVQSVTEQDMVVNMANYYYRMDEEAQVEDKTTFTFADGEVLTVPLDDKSIIAEYCKESMQHLRNSMYGVPAKQNHYSIRVNDTTEYLRLKTFDLMSTEVARVLAFLQNLQTDGCENLIIDLCNNPGGDADVMYALLDAVMDEPIKHEGGCDVYKGRIYVITNAGTASTASMFAGIMKRNNRGYVVGRETKTAYHTMNAEKFVDIQLANSRFKCHIPMVRIVMDEYVSEEFPYGRGVMPHLNIPISYEEVAVNGFLLYSKTLELIEKGIYLEDTDDIGFDMTDKWVYMFVALLLLTVTLAYILYIRKRRRR